MRHTIAWALTGAISGIVLTAYIVFTANIVFFMSFASAQTSFWQPTDTPSYTVLWKSPLWDADSQNRGDYISIVEPGHSGQYAGTGVSVGPLNNLSETWTRPVITIERADLTAFGATEVWFWLKADSPCEVMIQGIANLAVTQAYKVQVDTEWQLVRIPLDQLDAGNDALTRIDQWSLHCPTRVPLYVDDVWAVRLGPPPVEPTPTPEPEPEPTPEPEPAPNVTYTYSIFVPIQVKAIGSDGSTHNMTFPISISVGVPEVHDGN